MSSNHKAPLAAFVVVAIACVVVLATNSMRSYARDAWRDFAAPVVSGRAFLPSEHQEPAEPAVVSETQDSDEVGVPAGPAGDASTTPQHHPGARKVHHSGGAATKTTPKPKPTRAADGSGTVSAASTVPAAPATTAPEPVWPAAHQEESFGSHQAWAHGKHQGWGSSHGSSSPSTYSNASTRGYGNGHANGFGSRWKSSGARSHGNEHGASASNVTHGPSWKTADMYAGSSLSKAQDAKAQVRTKGGSWGNHGHGHGYSGSHHGRGR